MTKIPLRSRRGLWAAACMCAVLAVTTDAASQSQPACEPAVLTTEEAAQLLRVDAAELIRLAERGNVPARRIGRSWRFSCPALMAFLAGDVPRRESPTPLQPEDLARVAAAGTASRGGQTAAPAPAPPVDGQAQPIGEAPGERTAEDVFLRGRRVLLGRGGVVVDVGQFYSRSDSLQLVSADDGVGLAIVEQQALATVLVGRVGIVNDAEFVVSTAFFKQDLGLFLGDATLARFDRSEFAGVGVGVRQTLLREAAGRPNVIASFDAQIPRGGNPYAIGGGLVLVKSVDPVVLFASANYNHAFSRDADTGPRLEPSRRIDVSVGYGWALNDTLALSTAVAGTFTGTTALPNASTRQGDSFSLRFALTSALARGLYIEPSVSVGLSGPSDSFAFGVTVPYSF